MIKIVMEPERTLPTLAESNALEILKKKVSDSAYPTVSFARDIEHHLLTYKRSRSQLAQNLNIDVGAVNNWMSTLAWPNRVRENLQNIYLTHRDLQAISHLSDPVLQVQLSQEVKEGKVQPDQISTRCADLNTQSVTRQELASAPVQVLLDRDKNIRKSGDLEVLPAPEASASPAQQLSDTDITQLSGDWEVIHEELPSNPVQEIPGIPMISAVPSEEPMESFPPEPIEEAIDQQLLSEEQILPVSPVPEVPDIPPSPAALLREALDSEKVSADLVTELSQVYSQGFDSLESSLSPIRRSLAVVGRVVVIALALYGCYTASHHVKRWIANLGSGADTHARP